MKLIDLLVQELPKRGGWPDGADCCCLSGVDSDGVTIQFRFIPRRNEFLFIPDYDHLDIPYKGDTTEFITCGVITKEVYQLALAAAKKPAWNGEGLPPVGCECEYISNGTSWGKVKVIGLDGEKIVIRPSGEIYYAITPSNKDVFIPFRTEAEKKHESVLESICAVLEMVAQDYKREDEAKLIYEAIAAGKIPGVKLDD